MVIMLLNSNPSTAETETSYSVDASEFGEFRITSNRNQHDYVNHHYVNDDDNGHHRRHRRHHHRRRQRSSSRHQPRHRSHNNNKAEQHAPQDSLHALHRTVTPTHKNTATTVSAEGDFDPHDEQINHQIHQTQNQNWLDLETFLASFRDATNWRFVCQRALETNFDPRATHHAVFRFLDPRTDPYTVLGDWTKALSSSRGRQDYPLYDDHQHNMTTPNQNALDLCCIYSDNTHGPTTTLLELTYLDSDMTVPFELHDMVRVGVHQVASLHLKRGAAVVLQVPAHFRLHNVDHHDDDDTLTTVSRTLQSGVTTFSHLDDDNNKNNNNGVQQQQQEHSSSNAPPDPMMSSLASSAASSSNHLPLGTFAVYCNPQRRERVCDGCGIIWFKSMPKCSRCQSVRYCSQLCQRRHWTEQHRWQCQPATDNDNQDSVDDNRSTCSSKTMSSSSTATSRRSQRREGAAVDATRIVQTPTKKKSTSSSRRRQTSTSSASSTVSTTTTTSTSSSLQRGTNNQNLNNNYEDVGYDWTAMEAANQSRHQQQHRDDVLPGHYTYDHQSPPSPEPRDREDFYHPYTYYRDDEHQRFNNDHQRVVANHNYYPHAQQDHRDDQDCRDPVEQSRREGKRNHRNARAATTTSHQSNHYQYHRYAEEERQGLGEEVPHDRLHCYPRHHPPEGNNVHVYDCGNDNQDHHYESIGFEHPYTAYNNRLEPEESFDFDLR